MDKVTHYQSVIKTIFEEVAVYYKGTTNHLDVITILDNERNHFQLLMHGWDGDDYIFQCLMHLDIKDKKIWIQWNDTEIPVEEDLIKGGVASTDIVLGLKHPDYRQYTDFATT